MGCVRKYTAYASYLIVFHLQVWCESTVKESLYISFQNVCTFDMYMNTSSIACVIYWPYWNTLFEDVIIIIQITEIYTALLFFYRHLHLRCLRLYSSCWWQVIYPSYVVYWKRQFQHLETVYEFQLFLRIPQRYLDLHQICFCLYELYLSG